jgi:hypothetical protein
LGAKPTSPSGERLDLSGRGEHLLDLGSCALAGGALDQGLGNSREQQRQGGAGLLEPKLSVTGSPESTSQEAPSDPPVRRFASISATERATFASATAATSMDPLEERTRTLSPVETPSRSSS